MTGIRFECPIDRSVLNTFRLASRGTIRAARLALEPGLALLLDGLAERDRVVFDWAAGREAAVSAVLAGGYAILDEHVVEIHFRMVEELLRRVR